MTYSDFDIYVTQMADSALPGSKLVTKVTVSNVRGYDHNVFLNAYVVHSGIIVSFKPESKKPPYDSIVTIEVGSDVPIANHLIKIKGVGSDGKEHSFEYILNVIPPASIPQISNIKSSGEKVRTGQSVQLHVDILNNPSNMDLAFEWSADTGTIEPPSGSRTITYHAPSTTGSATISLAVKNSDNDTTIDIKTHLLQIFPKPTTVDVIANFVFIGWIGDGEVHGEDAITIDDEYTKEPYSPPTCLKFTYRPMSTGWAGIYAQYDVENTEENWGVRPGMYLTGYTKLSWYAKGETGNEMVEFKAGGIDAPGKQYRDSFEHSLSTIRLEKEWTRYEMNLSNEDLSSVIGGFCWVVTKRANPNGLTFYVDSITYE